jgi:hypothetical protein
MMQTLTGFEHFVKNILLLYDTLTYLKQEAISVDTCPRCMTA